MERWNGRMVEWRNDWMVEWRKNHQILKDGITDRGKGGKSSEILKDGMTEYQPKSLTTEPPVLGEELGSKKETINYHDGQFWVFFLPLTSQRRLESSDKNEIWHEYSLR